MTTCFGWLKKLKQNWKVLGFFNTSFIALIPKVDKLNTCNDFHPISLYNYIYNILSKVIAVRLKKILPKIISAEKFGFLEGRFIHEAMGSTQGALHTIRQKKQATMVMKIDLSKAYDRACWLYLRSLLIHIKLNRQVVDWVMGCVITVSFVILINGADSPFFKPTRGLRQGCPLSPYLFLLVVEGLSKTILAARRKGNIVVNQGWWFIGYHSPFVWR
jgi:hypothetical protein